MKDQLYGFFAVTGGLLFIAVMGALLFIVGSLRLLVQPETDRKS